MKEITPRQMQIEGMTVGIERAVSHASRVHDCDWAEAALSYFKEWLSGKESGYTFTCEEVRHDADDDGFLYADGRAWGGVMRKACGKDENLTKKFGVTHVGPHGRFGVIWIKQ